MYQFSLGKNKAISKVKQIVHSIIMSIETGDLKKNERLISINEFSRKYKVARDTVEKAYNILKDEKYLISVKGKGYFVTDKPDGRLRILLIFNKLSSYKKIIYESFIQTIGENAKVDLHIHQYNPTLLKESVENNVPDYHYVVVMPHFFHTSRKKEYHDILRTIPPEKLMLLDKDLPQLNTISMAVYQDFQRDIYDALGDAKDLIEKYQGITLCFPKHSHHPVDIVKGGKLFCDENKKQFNLVSEIDEAHLKPGFAFIVLTESDLAYLIKSIRKTEHILGQDIGILSFNETVFKELLDITVITTDFEAMGRLAADMLLKKQKAKIRNPFLLIRRQSL